MRLDARADVEAAVVDQRPAALGALRALEVGGDLRLDAERVALAEVMLQQHVFGRNGGVGFELEQPMAVRPLQVEERSRGALDRALERGLARRLRRSRWDGADAHFIHDARKSSSLR